MRLSQYHPLGGDRTCRADLVSEDLLCGVQAVSLSLFTLLPPALLPPLPHVIFATFAVLTCQLQNNYYVTVAGGSYRRNLPSLNQR